MQFSGICLEILDFPNQQKIQWNQIIVTLVMHLSGKSQSSRVRKSWSFLTQFMKLIKCAELQVLDIFRLL